MNVELILQAVSERPSPSGCREMLSGRDAELAARLREAASQVIRIYRKFLSSFLVLHSNCTVF